MGSCYIMTMNKKENLIWYITSVLVCAALCIMYVCSKKIAVEDISVETAPVTTISETEQYIPGRSLSDDMFVSEVTDDDVLYEIVTASPETTTQSENVATSEESVPAITEKTTVPEVPVEKNIPDKGTAADVPAKAIEKQENE